MTLIIKIPFKVKIHLFCLHFLIGPHRSLSVNSGSPWMCLKQTQTMSVSSGTLRGVLLCLPCSLKPPGIHCCWGPQWNPSIHPKVLPPSILKLPPLKLPEYHSLEWSSDDISAWGRAGRIRKNAFPWNCFHSGPHRAVSCLTHSSREYTPSLPATSPFSQGSDMSPWGRLTGGGHNPLLSSL